MIRKLVLLVACASLAPPASSQVTEVARNRFDCVAEPGQLSSTDVSRAFGGTSMSARIRFVDGDPDPRWATAAGLVFRLDSGRHAAVMVYALPGSPDYLFVGLKPPGSNEATGMVRVRRSNIVEVSATMARGAIFARVGEQRGQIYVGNAQLAGKEVMCQSGRFEIELIRRPRPPRPY